jgi:hypothetical protein
VIAARVFRGTFVAAGVKRAHGIGVALLNAVTLIYSKPFVANLSNAERHYANIESLLGKLESEEYL